jgi:transcriptional regulator of acetoin/glycerol metabolism
MSGSNVRCLRTKAAATSANAPACTVNIDFFRLDGHIRLLDIERDLLFLALRRHKGCVTEAAAELGIGKSTFYRRLAEIIRPTFASNDQQII